MKYERKTINAQNMYTESLPITGEKYVGISVHPTVSGVADIYVQKAFMEDQSTWNNVLKLTMIATTDDQEYISNSPEPEDVLYRIGCPTGSYTNGTYEVRVCSTGGA